MFQSGIAAARIRQKNLVLAGLVLFLVSFFLPVLPIADGTPPFIVGWQCAWYAVPFALDDFRKNIFSSLLLAMSDLINPLAVLLLLLRPVNGKQQFKKVLCGLVILCMIATWVWFAMIPVVPKFGHFVWIIGVALIMLSQRSGSTLGAQPEATAQN